MVEKLAVDAMNLRIIHEGDADLCVLNTFLYQDMRQCAVQSGFIAGKDFLTADNVDLELSAVTRSSAQGT